MGRGVILLGILLVGLQAWAGPMRLESASPKASVPRATGGPDAFGYRYIDSQETGGPVFATEWENISTTGTPITFGNYNPPSIWGAADEGEAQINLGFSFPYYGNTYTDCWVNTNGFIKFGSPTVNNPVAFSNQTIPTAGGEDNIICPLWRDNLGVTARYAALGTAPNRRFVVHWAEGTQTHELKIYENGTILALIQNNNGYNFGTIGIENSTGTTGLLYTYQGNPNPFANNLAILFYPGNPPDPPTNLIQSASANGASAPVGFVSDATAYFRATVTDPDTADFVGVEVEILPANLTFQSSVTGQTARTAPANLVPNGSVAEASYIFDGNPFGSGDYQWRVRAIDANGNESAWVTFSQTPIQVRVDLNPPPAPPTISPQQNQSVAGGDIRFVWQAVSDVGPAGVDYYEVQASLSAGFAILLGTDQFTQTQGTLFLPTSDQPYYWRVRAVDNGGNASAWSTPILFLTKFDDGINHGGGDCATSAGTQPGMILAIWAGMLTMGAAFAARRRRARTG